MDLQSLDLAGLGLFAAAVAVLAAAAVLVSGFLPLSARRPWQRGPVAAGLLLLALATLALLAVMALRFAAGALPTAPAVIAGGLALLAGPLVFQLLPGALRDRPGGLLLVLLAGGTLVLLLNRAA